jgi:hypothetical protein
MKNILGVRSVWINQRKSKFGFNEGQTIFISSFYSFNVAWYCSIAWDGKKSFSGLGIYTFSSEW